MRGAGSIELGLTIPLQRHLGLKALPYGEEPDRRFCWDLHVIPLRGRPSLLAVHCQSRYAFVLYDLSRLDWEHLPLFTKTHGRREVAFLNRAWDDVMAAELTLDENTQSQPLLDQIVNAKLSRCAGFDGLGMAVERLSAVLRELS